MIELRDTQDESIRKLSEGIKAGHKRQILMSATGTGKTVIAACIIQRALEKGKIIWFLVDSLELASQARDTFAHFGIDSSTIQGRGNPLTNYKKKVQIITKQTLKNRWSIWDINPHWLPNLIINDECHVQYKADHQIAMGYPDIPVIGLSATPFSKGLGKLYSNLVIGEVTKEAIERNHLCDFDAYAPFTPDMKGVKTNGDDYSNLEASMKVDTKEVVGDIVKTWKKFGRGKPTLAFALNIAHSKSIADEFNRSGIHAVHLDGYTDLEERKRLIDAYKAGEIPVLVSVQVLVKGFDAPNAEVAILAAPTKSLMKHIQVCGRVLRTHPDKEKALILDHAGNFERLGFPTDILPTELCSGDKAEIAERKKEREKEMEEKLPHPCFKCKALITEFVCPHCGHVPVIEHGVVNTPGELKKVKAGVSPEEKSAFYAEMLHHARDKGFKDGWAAHAHKTKYGHYPHKKDGIEPIEPSEATKKYIKHLAIKRRFSKKRA